MSDNITGTTRLLGLSCHHGVNEADPAHFQMKYSPHDPNKPTIPTAFINAEVVATLELYSIPKEGSFVPEKVEIRGQKSSRTTEDMRRLFLLGKDRLHYKVLKIPANVQKRTDEDTSMS